jgi:predicted Zn-dependent protease
MKLTRLALFPLTIFFLFSSCVRNPVTGKRDFMLMSESQEIAMGKQSDPEIKSFFGVYDDNQLQKFIQQKGKAMAAISHRPDLPYEFKVVDSPVVNAFAVPGGYIYFTRGIMAHFNNEAEFAGVLGHEIGHVTARHSAKQYSKAMLAQVGMVAGMVLSPEFRQFADLANTGVSLLFLKFGRDAENEADRLGVEYSTKIDYDAEEMAGFFQTLQRLQEQSGGGAVPTFMSTHPHPGDRFNNVTKLAEKWQKKLNKENLETDRDGYLKMIDGIVYGEDPRQGFVENNIFYHPVLKFQFPTPQGWAFQNTPAQVQMANKEGNAAMVFRLAPGNSLREAAQQTLTKNNLTAVESKEVNVNGYSALAVVADQQPQQQQMQQQQQAPPIRVLAYFIQDSQTIYNFLGYAAQPDFQQYYPTFNSVISNFRELTDPTKLNRKPDRVRVKPVAQNGTLQQAFQQLNVPTKQMQELALLNGMELNETVQKGTLVKVIESGNPALSRR